MNGGYVMLDFSGKVTGTDAIFASEIVKAIATKKMIIAHNLNGQSPVVLTADANGVLSGGGVTVSVSGTTVTIASPVAGSVSDIRIISGEKTGNIAASAVGQSTVPLVVPDGYSVIGVTSLIVTSANNVTALAIRGWRMSAGGNGIDIFYGNQSAETATSAKFTVSALIGKIAARQSRESADEVGEIPIEKKTAKKGSVK